MSVMKHYSILIELAQRPCEASAGSSHSYSQTAGFSSVYVPYIYESDIDP